MCPNKEISTDMKSVSSFFAFCKTNLRLLELAYLLSIAVIGVFLVYRVTPVSGVDEEFHFYRAQQIAQGNLLAQRYSGHMFGGGLDTSMLTWVRYFNANRDQHKPSDSNVAAQIAKDLENSKRDREVVHFPSTASYSPLMYIPSATAMIIANAGHGGVDTRYYAGRLGNLFGYIGMLALVLAVLPVGRLAVLALMTTPTSLHLATTYSADPVTNLGSMLFLACCLRARMAPPEDRKIWIRLIIALAAPLGLFKLTCSFLSLGCVLVPTNSFPTQRKYIQFCMTVVGLSLVSAVVWNGIYPFTPAHYWNTGGDPKVQILTMLEHPWSFVREIAETYRVGSHWWWEDAWGRFGGGPVPLFFKIGEGTGYVAIALIVLLTLADKRPIASPRSGAILIALGALYSLLTLLAFYVGFSHLGEDTVSGLQGRYFYISCAAILSGVLLFLPRQNKTYQTVCAGLLGAYFVCVAHVCIEATGIYARLWN